MKIILIGLGVWVILVIGFMSLFKAASRGDRLIEEINEKEE